MWREPTVDGQVRQEPLEPGKLTARRVPPHPLSLRDAPPHCAGAGPHPPHRRPQPPVAAAAAAPAPLPLPLPSPGTLALPPAPPLRPPPLLHVGSEQIRLHVSLRGTCRDPGSGPAPLLPDPPHLRVRAPSADAAPAAGRGVSGLQCLADKRRGSPLLPPPTFTHTPLCWGCQPRRQVVLCSWGDSEEGAQGGGTAAIPKPFTSLLPECLGGVPIALELSRVRASVPGGDLSICFGDPPLLSVLL